MPPTRPGRRSGDRRLGHEPALKAREEAPKRNGKRASETLGERRVGPLGACHRHTISREGSRHRAVRAQRPGRAGGCPDMAKLTRWSPDCAVRACPCRHTRGRTLFCSGPDERPSPLGRGLGRGRLRADTGARTAGRAPCPNARLGSEGGGYIGRTELSAGEDGSAAPARAGGSVRADPGSAAAGTPGHPKDRVSAAVLAAGRTDSRADSR